MSLELDIRFLELKVEEMENNDDTQSEEYERALKQLAWYKELREYREEFASTMMDEYYVDDEDENEYITEDEFNKVKNSPEAKETLDKLYKGISNIN